MNKNIQSLGKTCGIVSGASPPGSSCRRNDDRIGDGRDPELFDRANGNAALLSAY